MKRITTLLAALIITCLPLMPAGAADVVFGFEAPVYSVFIGKTLRLKVIALGIGSKPALRWKTSDETVATVKNGLVKGVSGGTATLTCTAARGGKTYTATCEVTVKIPVKAMKTAVKSVEIAPGHPTLSPPANRYIPTVSVEPEDATNKDIVWTSSAWNVAFVDRYGTVTGKSPGTATITGKAADGSGQTVSYKVTVPACYVTDSSLTVTEESGVTLGYCVGSDGGAGAVDIRVSGNSFTVTPLKDRDGLSMLRIMPLKAGSGNISFVVNKKTVRAVKVTVRKSAARDNSSYPKTDPGKAAAAPDSYTGKPAQIAGTVLTAQPLASGAFIDPGVFDVFHYATDAHAGQVTACTDGKERRYFMFEYAEALLLKPGEKLTVFGTIDHFEAYTDETGTACEIPCLVNVTVRSR